MLKSLIFVSLFYVTWADVQTYRLPNNVVPKRYLLTIQPNLVNQTFNGTVIIDLHVNVNSQTITLHKRRIKIIQDSIRVIASDGTEIKVTNTTKDKINETFTIHTETELVKKTKYHLIIGSFHGWSKGVHHGFYTVSYYDKTGDERHLVMTDFEPNDARQAFPCFDEPALKAKFIINIIRPKEYNSVSNEELESTIFLGNDLFQDVYKETPVMSTYLVAFAVSEFKYINQTNKYKIYGRPQAIEENTFTESLSALQPITEALEEYTGIKYVLKKTDQFAVPGNGFVSNAMENWGLITYRESALDCSNSSEDLEISGCILTIAHELSHQWFGNLVGPKWWDSIWLNEGFASHFMYYIADRVYPERRYMEQYLVTTVHAALSQDSKEYYQGYSVGENHLKLAANGRVSIVYQKGSAVIRMIENFMTPELFRKGLQIYLNANKFGSVQASDLYRALQLAITESKSNHLLGDLNVATILNNWINQPGYPVVNVVRDYKTGSITFTQKKFETIETGSEDDDEHLWHVPINYVFQNSPQEKFEQTHADFWLSGQNYTVENASGDGWILVNNRQTGFYRVNYDLENWERIIEFMRNDDFEAIPAESRAQLIDDAFSLAQAKQLPYEIPFKLTQYLMREHNYLPFKTFRGYGHDVLEYFQNLFKRKKHEEILTFWNYTVKYTKPEEFVAKETFGDFMVHILTPVYNYLGTRQTSNDTYFDRILRPIILSQLCPFVTEVTNDLLEDFENLQYHNMSVTNIAPNLQSYVFCEGAKSSKGKEFLLKLYSESNDFNVKRRIKNGLTCYHQSSYVF